MEWYIGIDDHASSCTLAVVDERGTFREECTLSTDLVALQGYLDEKRGARHVVLENGSRAQWLADGLREHCETLMVANLCGTRPYRLSKNDRLDARELAQLHRQGMLRPVYQRRQPLSQALREAARGYEQVRGDMVRTKNRLKAVFRSQGVACKNQEVYQKAHRAEYLQRLPSRGGKRSHAQMLMEQLEALGPVQQRSKRLLLRQTRRRREEFDVLRSVDGLGPISVALLLGTIDDPHRIRSKQALWRMSGLAVRTASSGDYATVDVHTGEVVREPKVRTLGLNRDYNRTLKSIFKTAALNAIRTRHSPYRQHYQHQLRRGQRPKLARLTIARKISAAAWSCWKNQTPFDAQQVLRSLG